MASARLVVVLASALVALTNANRHASSTTAGTDARLDALSEDLAEGGVVMEPVEVVNLNKFLEELTPDDLDLLFKAIGIDTTVDLTAYLKTLGIGDKTGYEDFLQGIKLEKVAEEEGVSINDLLEAKAERAKLEKQELMGELAAEVQKLQEETKETKKKLLETIKTLTEKVDDAAANLTQAEQEAKDAPIIERYMMCKNIKKELACEVEENGIKGQAKSLLRSLIRRRSRCGIKVQAKSLEKNTIIEHTFPVGTMMPKVCEWVSACWSLGRPTSSFFQLDAWQGLKPWRLTGDDRLKESLSGMKEGLEKYWSEKDLGHLELTVVE